MTNKSNFRLGVLAGDGIGPEITEATVRVLEAAAGIASAPVTLTPAVVGWKAYEKSKSTLPDETLNVLNASDGWILGPTFAGEYPKDDPIRGHPSGFLRRHFKLFGNVRPVEAWSQFNPLIPDLKVTIIRENTEGFYPDRNLAWGYGEFKPTEDVALSLRVITGVACDRFARFALEHAKANGNSVLHIAHKRTAMPQTEGLFISAFEKLQPEFPDISVELLRIDTFSSSFPREPHRYKLVATTNLFGDILSDQASGLAGGVGMAASLNAGTDKAMAQAVHGTAPDIAGQGKANPSALILSAAMLMTWWFQKTGEASYRKAATLMEEGVRRAVETGNTTADLGGKAGTAEFADAVIKQMQK
ncbi:isocitrate/isopropylmalate dehydrogenase family protein [Rhizobium sp. P32RR-XVIII]|uniref:isocitrate/isopropylmalate dehydrogenase family protein n=1 Tax=Rhizobium sp. P32RR-XVIII TaxID=2726738 RepID=UPI0014569529|nr:isocitrate/isopropylmalate family dehydrogenase [Rhizobium sp. P32RR-XVIII]NLS06073.1 isocitrate/isopropylmalate dehydrogenase family protein [Rhizobium sp. P32RR-XVIII]